MILVDSTKSKQETKRSQKHCDQINKKLYAARAKYLQYYIYYPVSIINGTKHRLKVIS